MHNKKSIHLWIMQVICMLHIISYSQSSYVRTVRTETKSDISQNDDIHPGNELSELRRDVRDIQQKYNRNMNRKSRRWSHRRRLGTLFSPWTHWSPCDHNCRQKRERYCTVRRKCGETVRIEERSCPPNICDLHYQHLRSNLQPQVPSTYIPTLHSALDSSTSILPFTSQHLPVKQITESVDGEPNTNFIILKQSMKKMQTRNHHKKKRKPIIIDIDDLEFDEDPSDDENTGDEDYNSNSQSAEYSSKGNNYKNYDEEDADDATIIIRGRKNKKSSRRKPQKNWDRQDFDGGFHPINATYIFSSNKTELNNQLNDISSKPLDYSSIFRSSSNLYVSEDRYENNESQIMRRSDVGVIDDANYIPTNQTKSMQMRGKRNGKEKSVFHVPGNENRFRRIFGKWRKWSKCTEKCTTRRFKRCKLAEICGTKIVREVAYCYTEGSFCQKWIDNQIEKNHNPYKQVGGIPKTTTTTTHRPQYHQYAAQSRHDSNGLSNIIGANSNYNHQYVDNVKAISEYTPQKLKCGLPAIRNRSRHQTWGMLRIIGGKTARKGQWPWQVAILNKFKEAFCGGTLVSPNWVLTAAHCVRRKLYVRLAEHNLNVDENTEIEYRIEESIKHPRYDKTTVDSDIAMLRLPKKTGITLYIGYACLPQSYQLLPKSHQCTIIGWGKRRNSDDAGTNVLHQAEVPIIPNEDCKKVYYDYTITKNMFCAGHRRGRIDTCAGDSGGPLLCRDTTLPDQPWTIFGITSFGDGCGKRNKFGIYTKVPNYVDWIWSVINCNGYCKSTASDLY